MDKTKQCELILDYLKTHNGITAKEAMERLGIARLASRIFDLKEAGFSVTSIFENGKNRYGLPTRYKRYYVEEISNGRMDQTTP